jgi:hypothetical protein
MKARAFMGALAMAIAGAGCSAPEDCSATQTTTVDPGVLTGTVTGPAALGFPAPVHDLGSSYAGGPWFNASGVAADGGTDVFQLEVHVYGGPDLTPGQPVTLPDPTGAYGVYCTLTDLTSGAAIGKPTVSDGTLTLNQTTSNGTASNETVTSDDLTLTLTLIAPDGSPFGVDAELVSQTHTYTGPVVCVPVQTGN